MILITGFDPFGGESVNPSFEAVRALPDIIDGVSMKKLQLPTVFDEAADLVIREVERLHPTAVISVGQAGGRRAVTVERVAINLQDARIADNAGNAPQDRAIVPGGPAAYFATLPIRAMVSAITAAGLPAAISNSAGTFVCNDVMYRVLHHLATHAPATPGGFIHVPFIPEQVVGKPADTYAMPLTDITRALSLAISATIRAM